MDVSLLARSDVVVWRLEGKFQRKKGKKIYICRKSSGHTNTYAGCKHATRG